MYVHFKILGKQLVHLSSLPKQEEPTNNHDYLLDIPQNVLGLTHIDTFWNRCLLQDKPQSNEHTIEMEELCPPSDASSVELFRHFFWFKKIVP